MSKFWRLESCLSASLLRSQVLADMTLYIIGVSAIWTLLYIIRCLRECDLGTPIYNRYQTHGRFSRKKNFSENLVDSKSCRTFASATPKKGWSEVSDARLEIGYDDI